MADVDYVVEVESPALKRNLRLKLGGRMRVRRRPGRRYVQFVEIKHGISAATAVSSELAIGVFVGEVHAMFWLPEGVDGMCFGSTPKRASASVRQFIDAFDRAPEQFIVRFDSKGRGVFEVEFLDGQSYEVSLGCSSEHVAVSKDRHYLLVRPNGSEATTVPWDYIRQPDSHVAEHERTKRKIGRALLDLRIQTDITQTEAAKRSGLSRVTISRLERGENLPDVSTLKALAVAYRIGVKPLLAKFRS